MSMSFPFRLRFAAAAAFTAAIAASPAALAQPAPPAPPASVPAPASTDDLPTGLSAELFYRLLLGDIALQRGDAALAARAYLEVAQELKDVRLARRLVPRVGDGARAARAFHRFERTDDARLQIDQVAPDAGHGAVGVEGLAHGFLMAR